MTQAEAREGPEDEREDLGPVVDWLSELEEGREDGSGTSEGAGPRRPRRPKVGYMRGRGGMVTRTPVAALDVLNGELREVLQGVEGLARDLRRIEQAFFLVERAFKRTQPPMFRRLHVRWWLLSGKSSRRVPVLVRINGNRAGAELAERVEDRRVRLRQDGSFGLCVDLNREVFETYWALWALRAEGHEALAAIVVALRGWSRRRAGGPERQAFEALRLRAKATDRLRRVGFEFGEEVAPEWPLPEDFWEWLDGQIAWVVREGQGREEWTGGDDEPSV